MNPTPKPVMGKLFTVGAVIYGAMGASKVAECVRKEYADELVLKFNGHNELESAVRYALTECRRRGFTFLDAKLRAALSLATEPKQINQER